MIGLSLSHKYKEAAERWRGTSSSPGQLWGSGRSSAGGFFLLPNGGRVVMADINQGEGTKTYQEFGQVNTYQDV